MREAKATTDRLQPPRLSVDVAQWLRRLLNIGRHFPTPLAAMMGCRAACAALVAIAGLQSALVALGRKGWPCPLHTMTGIPCPSCGLSRACAALLQGHWWKALNYHAFAYAVPPLLLILLAGALTSGRLHDWIRTAVCQLEQRTGVTAIAAIGFLAYYSVRLVLFRDAFLQAVGT